MPGRKDQRIVIAGGGLAGCLAALALARLRPEVPLLLLEQGSSFGGNHVWSFFDADVAAEDHWLVEPIIAKKLAGLRHICFRAGSGPRRRLCQRPFRAARRPVRERPHGPVQSRRGHRLGRSDGVTLEGGERIVGDHVVDARGAGSTLTRSTLAGKSSSAANMFCQPRTDSTGRS